MGKADIEDHLYIDMVRNIWEGDSNPTKRHRVCFLKKSHARGYPRQEHSSGQESKSDTLKNAERSSMKTDGERNQRSRRRWATMTPCRRGLISVRLRGSSKRRLRNLHDRQPACTSCPTHSHTRVIIVTTYIKTIACISPIPTLSCQKIQSRGRSSRSSCLSAATRPCPRPRQWQRPSESPRTLARQFAFLRARGCCQSKSFHRNNKREIQANWAVNTRDKPASTNARQRSTRTSACDSPHYCHRQRQPGADPASRHCR